MLWLYVYDYMYKLFDMEAETKNSIARKLHGIIIVNTFLLLSFSYVSATGNWHSSRL